MSNIVNEKTMPSIRTLQNIANALDVHISELFISQDKPKLAIKCPNCGEEIFIDVHKSMQK